ncbi:MAG: hypothetical protein XD78_1435 [Desulfotomaculum sp. 46_296]|nr:MAG: hypothetical protein XD78_1435 [Desulfotomaculum sp. 46_296]HAU31918.1 hypothetical protein [Desulfotomaculum sp.]
MSDLERLRELIEVKKYSVASFQFYPGSPSCIIILFFDGQGMAPEGEPVIFETDDDDCAAYANKIVEANKDKYL